MASRPWSTRLGSISTTASRDSPARSDSSLKAHTILFNLRPGGEGHGGESSYFFSHNRYAHWA